MLTPGQSVPDLDLELTIGARFQLSKQSPENFTMLVFYRGKHCPICKRYLEELGGKLDKYFDGKRVIEVKSATQGGTPVAKWMNLETGQPLAPWTQKLRPLLKDRKQPTIVLAQQSLQWAFGDRSAGIRNAQDTGNIRKGAGAIKKYADLLLIFLLKAAAPETYRDNYHDHRHLHAHEHRHGLTPARAAEGQA